VVLLDDELVGEDLFVNLGQVEAYSDLNILQSVAKTCAERGKHDLHIEALSLEVAETRSRNNFSKGNLRVTFRHSIALPHGLSHLTEEDCEISNNLSDEDFNDIKSVTELDHLTEGWLYHSIECLKEDEESDINKGSGNLTGGWLYHDIKCGSETTDPTSLVSDILYDKVVDTANDKKSVARYFCHPLAGKDDIQSMTNSLSGTRDTLVDNSARLEAAMKIILVQTARQLVSSYRRIIVEQARKLQEVEEDIRRQVSSETIRRLIDVTDTVTELAVEYLKNASRHVVDSSVDSVKSVVGSVHKQIEETHL